MKNKTKEIKHICFIMGTYPIYSNSSNIFVAKLIETIADQGIKCTVIAPQSSTRRFMRGQKRVEKVREVETKNGSIIKIFSPSYVSYSSKRVLGLSTLHLSANSFKKAVIKEYQKRIIKADAFYGHFLVPNGITAIELGIQYSKPSFLANGESSLNHLRDLQKKHITKTLRNVTGIVSVSSKNRNELLNNFTDIINLTDKIQVFPNAIDTNSFFQQDKPAVRKLLGFSEADFIVMFVGTFINRKGSLRLSRAIDMIGNVKSIFIGQGSEEPDCEGILFKGGLEHSQINNYLNAADVFVLPTLSEGCSNAIIEAMACGLPIISSNRDFNDDILNDENSIRIDPENVEQIRDAIIRLRDNQDLRESMSEASLEMAQTLNINQRAKNILMFMNDKAGY